MLEKSNPLTYNEKQEIMFAENRRVESLIKRYKTEIPNINAIWDLSIDSIKHNDINHSIVNAGLDIYIASSEAVRAGLFYYDTYEKNTIWGKLHRDNKIAKVIDAWENGIKLSPIFFVKHGSKSLALVCDGNHRLTVARYLNCPEIPFMVEKRNNTWLLDAIPSARKI